MIKEDKSLLLQDLSARLPYMPKIKIIYQQQGIKGTDKGKVSCDFIEKIVNDLRNGVITEMQIYLRPISSMTEEEKKEFHHIASLQHNYIGDDIFYTHWRMFDWLNANHFDYRGLIPIGLAIEVTKENNPYV